MVGYQQLKMFHNMGSLAIIIRMAGWMMVHYDSCWWTVMILLTNSGYQQGCLALRWRASSLLEVNHLQLLIVDYWKAFSFNYIWQALVPGLRINGLWGQRCERVHVRVCAAEFTFFLGGEAEHSFQKWREAQVFCWCSCVAIAKL